MGSKNNCMQELFHVKGMAQGCTSMHNLKILLCPNEGSMAAPKGSPVLSFFPLLAL